MFITYVYYDSSTSIVQSALCQVIEEVGIGPPVIRTKPEDNLQAGQSYLTLRAQIDFDLANKVYMVVDGKIEVADKPVQNIVSAPTLEERITAIEQATLNLMF